MFIHIFHVVVSYHVNVRRDIAEGSSHRTLRDGSAAFALPTIQTLLELVCSVLSPLLPFSYRFLSQRSTTHPPHFPRSPRSGNADLHAPDEVHHFSKNGTAGDVKTEAGIEIFCGIAWARYLSLMTSLLRWASLSQLWIYGLYLRYAYSSSNFSCLCMTA